MQNNNFKLLLKIDAQNLYQRIDLHWRECVDIFTQRRVRAPFEEMLKHRFDSATLEQLMALEVAQIEAVNAFYRLIDDLKWYLNYTQDMPNTVAEQVERKFHQISKAYVQLESLIKDNPTINNVNSTDSNSEDPPPPFENLS